MLVYVLSADGSPLMPTTNIRKVRHMLKDGRAVIAGHKPGLTIRLTYALPEQEAPRIQDTELCMDTGDHHIGLSVKSEKHEFVHAQYDLLPDEKKRHDACRKYRRTRRGRKRYRKARFDNRRKPEGWLAPSIKNKVERHAGLVKTYRAVLPVTDVVLETARFDTQLLEAEQRAKAGETVSVPKGKDYQHGPKFKLVNLREAVFTRDGYHCRICGKGPEDGAILHVHHALYWKGDHTDRMSGLLTVCDKCHTPANHKKGGKFFGLKPSVRSMAGAAFMNTIRWRILALVRTENPDIRRPRRTAGSAGALKRRTRTTPTAWGGSAPATRRVPSASRSAGGTTGCSRSSTTRNTSTQGTAVRSRDRPWRAAGQTAGTQNTGRTTSIRSGDGRCQRAARLSGLRGIRSSLGIQCDIRERHTFPKAVSTTGSMSPFWVTRPFR